LVGGCSKQGQGDKALWKYLSHLLHPLSDTTIDDQMKYLLFLFIITGIAACEKSAQSDTKDKEDHPATEKTEAPKSDAGVDTLANSEIPDLIITFEDGQIQSARSLKGKMLLILFQPDCDHCQREAVDFRNNMEHFKNIPIYFVSAAPIDEVKKFAEEYKLSQFSNIKWGTTTVSNILSSFGAIDAPSVYLYDEQSKLVHNFNGEVAVEVIVRSL
jgi:peroxiredoxin